MKKILFVTSECVPFVKTGGLADVCGSLPKAFDQKDYDIRVILPNYHAIKEEYRNQMETVYYFQMDNRIYVGIKTLTGAFINIICDQYEEKKSFALNLVFV